MHKFECNLVDLNREKLKPSRALGWKCDFRMTCGAPDYPSIAPGTRRDPLASLNMSPGTRKRPVGQGMHLLFLVRFQPSHCFREDSDGPCLTAVHDGLRQFLLQYFLHFKWFSTKKMFICCNSLRTVHSQKK